MSRLKFLRLSEVLDTFSQIYGQDWIKEGYFNILSALLVNGSWNKNGLSGGELTINYEKASGETRVLTFSKDGRLRIRLVLEIGSPQAEPDVLVIQTTSDLYLVTQRAFKDLKSTKLEADDLRRAYNVYRGHEDLGGIH